MLVLRTRPDGVSVTGKMGLVEQMMYRRFCRCALDGDKDVIMYVYMYVYIYMCV